MAFRNTNQEKREECETRNFKKASYILSGLFKNNIHSIEDTDITCSVDLRMSLKSGKKYIFELKPAKHDFKEYVLLVSKMWKMKMEQKDGERLFLMYLLDDRYYIFDIDNLQLSQLRAANILAKDTEYNIEYEEKKQQPAYFIKREYCCFSGLTN